MFDRYHALIMLILASGVGFAVWFCTYTPDGDPKENATVFVAPYGTVTTVNCGGPYVPQKCLVRISTGEYFLLRCGYKTCEPLSIPAKADCEKPNEIPRSGDIE